MVRTASYSYEQSSESGRERHLPVPYARCAVNPPIKGDPVQVVGTAGFCTCGTAIVLDAVDSIAIVNVAKGAVYLHNVRTVATYNPGVAELTWAVINIGTPVYYDISATMPANTFLSLSPLNTGGTANTLFGHVVMLQGETAASFPKAAGGAGNTHECAVQQA